MSSATRPTAHARTLRAAGAGLLLALLHRPAALAAQGPAPAPRDRGVQLGGRVQEVFNTSSVDTVPVTEWALRRARLEARFRLNRVVSGKVQPEYSGEHFSLKDAYVQLEAGPRVRLLAGQSHRPFSPFARANEMRIPVIEKSARIRGVEATDAQGMLQDLGYAGRDVGLQLLGALPGPVPGLQYELGAFRGPGHEEGGPGGYQLGGRLSAALSPRLHLGTAWSRRDFAPATPGAAAPRGGALVVDGELGSLDGGPHLLAEILAGDLDPALDRRFRAAQALATFRHNPHSTLLTGVEAGVRASVNRVTGGAGEGGVLVTPAASVYLHGLNRVTLNYDRWSPASGVDAEHGWKLLFQMVF